jgi:hypothetical protein
MRKELEERGISLTENDITKVLLFTKTSINKDVIREMYIERMVNGKKENERIVVAIPKNLIEDDIITVKGKGHITEIGETPGDLYLIVKIENDSLKFSPIYHSSKVKIRDSNYLPSTTSTYQDANKNFWYTCICFIILAIIVFNAILRF